MKPPRRHRNVTFKRLCLDAVQVLRVQAPLVRWFGRPFRPSREFAEIDITYKCDLKCINCNRSCTQAPSDTEMPVADVESFLAQSVAKDIPWRRIRILGGEPTLHRGLFDIVDLLLAYRRAHNPSVRLVLGTHYHHPRARRVLEKLPAGIVLKSTLKSSRVNLFKPFNSAPVDTVFNRFSDFTCGCRIMKECGLGVTPSGYYMCAIAGGIDRVFGFHLGRREIPAESDPLTDQTAAFCPLCGHFGFQWPTRRVIISETWRSAYRRYHEAGTPSVVFLHALQGDRFCCVNG